MDEGLKSLLGDAPKRGLGDELKLLQLEDDAKCFRQLGKEHQSHFLSNLVLEHF